MILVGTCKTSSKHSVEKNKLRFNHSTMMGSEKPIKIESTRHQNIINFAVHCVANISFPRLIENYLLKYVNGNGKYLNGGKPLRN